MDAKEDATTILILPPSSQEPSDSMDDPEPTLSQAPEDAATEAMQEDPEPTVSPDMMEGLSTEWPDEPVTKPLPEQTIDPWATPEYVWPVRVSHPDDLPPESEARPVRVADLEALEAESEVRPVRVSDFDELSAESAPRSTFDPLAKPESESWLARLWRRLTGSSRSAKPEAAPKPTPEPTPEPAPEPAPEAEARPESEIKQVQTPEPVAEAAAEPVAEVVAEEPVAESVVEAAAPEPLSEPPPETQPEPEEDIWAEFDGPLTEPLPEQSPEEEVWPVRVPDFDESLPEPAAESIAEELVAKSAEPVEAPVEELAAESVAESVVAPIAEPVVETAPELPSEPLPEPSPEPTLTLPPESASEQKSPEKLLGEALIKRGKLDPLALERAQRLYQDTPKEKFANLLITLGLVAPIDIAEALVELYDAPLVRADQFPELPILEERISPRFLREAKVLPLHEGEEELTLAMVDPGDTFTVEAFTMATGKRIVSRVALPSEIETALERLYGAGRSAVGQIVGDIGIETDEFGLNADVQQLKDLASEAPVIRLVSLIITNALSMRASDIHIEPFEDRLIVRYRIDGVLHEIESPPKRLSAAVISRVKIIANLDIAERRLPQDGRIRLRTQGKDIDLRVSTVPTMHGESVVMRILDKGGVALDFHKLGFSEKTLDRFLSALMQPNGILLVTGPTGSGKTTTLYTALDRLNRPDVKILTVEDPVEYQMPGINQIQVKPQIDLTFANALRSIVRQDPDIIMIGEIRDLETAQIAVQSALTGHLVLSTIHTNDSASTVNRLLDMGMEDYLLTSTVIGIQAQRLVRTLCEHCKEPYSVLPEMVEELGLRRLADKAKGDITLWHARGCKECSNTGYMGRVCILEVLLITDAVRSLVMKHAISGDIKEQAIADGMTTMYEDGLRKALAGVTTIEEVLRATRED